MATRKKSIEVYLDAENKLNITLIKEGTRLKKFAINYSAKVKDKWEAVYRVDNYHGFIHEQRLWLTKRPIPLPEYEDRDLKEIFDIFFEKTKEGCLRFRKYFERNRK